MTAVSVYSHTHSLTYVSDNILKSLKDIIRLSGLNPERLTNDWGTYMQGLKAWIESEHLERVVLEVYDTETNALIKRWDIDVVYAWSDSDGAFWTDTDQIKDAIKKAGVAPNEADYSLIFEKKPGAPILPGWSSCGFRSTSGLVRQSVGSTIEHQGLGVTTSYYRRA